MREPQGLLITRLVVLVAVGIGLATASPSFAGTTVDWGRGLVIADGVGIADRHAPSPAVARGTARRGAEEAARKAITAALPTLPLAAGGTLADRSTDAAVQTRLDRAVEAAMTLTADPETDGAWRVTMAVPIEAIRQALDGPRAVTASDAGSPVVILDGAKAKPAVGWRIAGAPAATLWVKSPPAWAKDAPRVKATARGADLTLAKPAGGPATVFVIVSG